MTFRVEETYKGTPAAEQTLRFLGGTVGDQTMEVPDMPKFEGMIRDAGFVNTRVEPILGGLVAIHSGWKV